MYTFTNIFYFNIFIFQTSPLQDNFDVYFNSIELNLKTLMNQSIMQMNTEYKNINNIFNKKEKKLNEIIAEAQSKNKNFTKHLQYVNKLKDLRMNFYLSFIKCITMNISEIINLITKALNLIPGASSSINEFQKRLSECEKEFICTAMVTRDIVTFICVIIKKINDLIFDFILSYFKGCPMKNV